MDTPSAGLLNQQFIQQPQMKSLITYHCLSRSALTLVEVVCATLIVGVMTVAALNTLGAATRSGMSAGNRAIALGLADELMAEILTSTYSNLDSFHNPELIQLTGDRADWGRRVTVERVVASDPTETTAGATDQGVKRIMVEVYYDDNGQLRLLAEQIALRTDND